MSLSPRRFVAILALVLAALFTAPVRAADNTALDKLDKSYDLNPNPDELPFSRLVIITRQDLPVPNLLLKPWAWLEGLCTSRN